MTTKNRALELVRHFLIGFALTLKGIDKLGHHAFIGSLLLAFGLIIFGFFFYSFFKKQHSESFNLITHCFEAIAALFMAYVFFTEGATYLPYLFLLAALGFFISIYVHHKKGNAHH